MDYSRDHADSIKLFNLVPNAEIIQKQNIGIISNNAFPLNYYQFFFPFNSYFLKILTFEIDLC